MSGQNPQSTRIGGCKNLLLLFYLLRPSNHFPSKSIHIKHFKAKKAIFQHIIPRTHTTAKVLLLKNLAFVLLQTVKDDSLLQLSVIKNNNILFFQPFSQAPLSFSPFSLLFFLSLASSPLLHLYLTLYFISLFILSLYSASHHHLATKGIVFSTLDQH